ncbi:MAG TPA: flagellar basal body P-ring protein FlgI [Terriglobales bacterium]|nr:flagellar basal body P-ring protein FlgI [Terriglobales bacterium]
MPMTRNRTFRIAALLAGLALAAAAATPSNSLEVPISDITTVAGVRDNLLVGYGLVVGLNGTGDRRQTLFTTQTLSNILQRMGVQTAPQQMMVYNVAAVFVTATLPPFSRPGMRIDITVSSTGDARSLAGGLLLLCALHGPDGEVYAEAQGPLTIGGFSAGNAQSKVQVNSTNVGIVPAGGIVERDTAVALSSLKQLTLLLREPDFVTANSIANAINHTLGTGTPAHAIDSRRVDVAWPSNPEAIPEFLAKVESLRVPVVPPARVVVDERTGTIVIGSNVQLAPVSILHGNLAVQVTTTLSVSQPSPFSSGGTTQVVPNTEVKANDQPAAKLTLQAGATVQDLVNGLQSIGANARDIVSILRAIKAAGALQAQLEVI